MTKQPKLFTIYKWYSNQVGWVRSSEVLGYSLKQVRRAHPQYTNKHLYLVCEAQ